MPRRNRTQGGATARQKGKGRKRGSGWHSGNGSDQDVNWRTHGAHLPQTGAQADHSLAVPVIVHSSATTRGSKLGSRWRGDAL